MLYLSLPRPLHMCVSFRLRCFPFCPRFSFITPFIPLLFFHSSIHSSTFPPVLPVTADLFRPHSYSIKQAVCFTASIIASASHLALANFHSSN